MFYELLYIIPNKYSEDECKEINAKINNLAQQENFKIASEDTLGKKKLAYPIKQSYFGYYFILNLGIEEGKSNLANLNKKLKLLPEVLRYQIVKYAKLPEKITEYKEHPAAPATTVVKEESSAVTQELPIKVEVPEEKQEQETKPAERKKEDKKTSKKVDLNDLDKKLDELLENVDV